MLVGRLVAIGDSTALVWCVPQAGSRDDSHRVCENPHTDRRSSWHFLTLWVGFMQ